MLKFGTLRSVSVKPQHGFTMTEIIVVLAIMAILAAIAIPNWSTLMPNYALVSGARQVQSALHKVKSRAVAENASFQLSFSGTTYYVQKYSGGSYTNTGESGTLPDGITLGSGSATTLGFTSRGTSLASSDTTVILCNIKSKGKNIVLSDTGRIRIDDASC